MESLKCLSKDCVNLLHKNKLLRALIRAEVILDTLKNVQIPEETKDETIKNYIKKLNLKKDEDLTKWLNANELSYKDFEAMVLSEVKLKEYCSNNFGSNIESRFMERKNQLDVVVYSIIRVSSYFKSREIYFRLTEKSATFGDLVDQFSEGIEKQTRGAIGPYPLTKAHPKLANLLRNSKVGEIQEPIEIDKTFLVVRLDSYQSARLDNDMRNKMGLELFEQLIISKVNDFQAGPGGISYMSGPAGSFQLNPKDSVLATTNPIPVQKVNEYPSEGSLKPLTSTTINNNQQSVESKPMVVDRNPPEINVNVQGVTRGKDIEYIVNNRPMTGGDAGFGGLA